MANYNTHSQQCLNYMEAIVCRAPSLILFSLPHRANAVAEYLGTEGPHTYFSVIQLLIASYNIRKYLRIFHIFSIHNMHMAFSPTYSNSINSRLAKQNRNLEK